MQVSFRPQVNYRPNFKGDDEPLKFELTSKNTDIFTSSSIIENDFETNRFVTEVYKETILPNEANITAFNRALKEATELKKKFVLFKLNKVIAKWKLFK